MWYWSSPFWGFSWIFPLMFIFCMVMMFLMMRAFFTGRFPCHTGHTGYRGQDSWKEGSSRKSSDGKEG